MPRVVAACGAIAMVLAGAMALGQATPPGADSSLYLETDRDAVALLEAARRAAAGRQWRKALELYQRVADYEGKDGAQPLAPAEGAPAVLLPIQEVAAAELARLPDDALRLYRQSQDDAAGALFRKALAARDPVLLASVARRCLASSWGDDALAALGALAFERGDFVGALAAWERLVALCRQPSVPTLSIRARMWICRTALGQKRRADELARRLAPDSAKKVAAGGSELTVAELLASAPGPPRPRPLREWPMLAGAPAGARPAAGPAQVGEPLWRHALPNPQLDAHELTVCRRRGLLPPLNVHATTRGGMVFVADQTAVYALAAGTGELRWAFPERAAPWLAGPFADTPHAVACAEGLAVARLGDQVVALDAATGRLVWRRSLRPVEPVAEGQEEKGHSLGTKVRVLASAPAVGAGRVVVGLAELGEEARASVVAFDLGTGERLWRTFVCSRSVPAFLGLGAAPSAPALDGASAYFVSNLGTVAALDLRSGTLRWVHRYPSLVAQLRRSSIERERRWANNPPLVSHGLVVAAPQDCWELLAIDAVGGSLRWAAPRGHARYLAGVASGRVFAVGDGVVALDVLSGRRLWSVALPGRALGRPALSERTLVVPTERALVAARTADGTLSVERLWQVGEAPGNLTMAAGGLLVATAGELVAFGDWAEQRKGFADPNAPDALLAAGLHEAHRGNYRAAIPLLERATRGGKAGEAREALFGCYMGVGRRGDEAALKKAVAVAPDAGRKAQALRALARLAEEGGRPAEAVAAWRELLESAGETTCGLAGGLVVSARALAEAEIARLVGKYGREACPGASPEVLAKLRALGARPEGPPTERLWNVYTRIAHRRVEVVKVAGAPEGLVFLAAQRRTFDRPSAFGSLECRSLATGELLWQREFDEWDELAAAAGSKLVVAIPNEVLALDPRSGATAWTFATAPEANQGPSLRRPGLESYRVAAVASDGSRVFVATSGGRVVGLSAADGRELWSRKLTTRVVLVGGLFVVDGKLWVVGESPAALFALDVASGEPKAQLDLGLAELGVRLPRVTDEPAFATEKATLYLVVDDRTVHAVDLRAGRLLWRAAVDFSISRVVVSGDGRLCYVVPERFVHKAQLLALDPASGKVVRRRSVLAGSVADATLGSKALFVAERNNDGDLVVEALDPGTLTARWRSVPLRLFRPSPLALGEGYLAVVGREGQWQQVAVLATADGKVAGDIRPLGAAYATVAFAGGHTLVVCTDRGIFAYGSGDRVAVERRVVGLSRRWRAGERSALAPLARELCRLGEEERAIALLDEALRDEGLPDADYARLKDVLNSAREALAARRPALLKCPRMSVPPNIDGAIDEPWRRESAARLDGPAHVEEVQGVPWRQARWRSAADLSAVLYTGWDSRYFYFAVDVSDDVHRTYTSRSDTWVGDGLIIAIDGDNDGGYGYRFASNDQLLTLALTRKEERRDDEGEEPSGEYRVRLKEDNSGAVYEVAIPWSFLGIAKPRPGLRFGFNVTVTDDDSDRAAKALSWTPGMILDRDKMLMIRGFTPAYFGDVLLTGPPEGPGGFLEPPVAPRGKGVRVRRLYPRKEN